MYDQACQYNTYNNSFATNLRVKINLYPSNLWSLLNHFIDPQNL